MNIIDVLQRMAYDTKTKLLGKVDKAEGKALSSNDFSNDYKTKLDGIADGATANVGTITGIKMNGESKGTSGNVDIGTVITSHQDISGKQDKTDNSLETTSKEIVGAINEINSNFDSIVKMYEGTITQTGDYIIPEEVLSKEDDYSPICAFYKTSYQHWRPLTVGYILNKFILMNVVEGMVNRPFYILCIKSV